MIEIVIFGAGRKVRTAYVDDMDAAYELVDMIERVGKRAKQGRRAFAFVGTEDGWQTLGDLSKQNYDLYRNHLDEDGMIDFGDVVESG